MTDGEWLDGGASGVQNNSVDALDLLCYDFLDRKA